MMLNKKFSKVLCTILAFAMIVTMLPAMALVASADEATDANVGINKLAFSDIANSPYQREIGVLSAISVLAGDPEGTFRPGDSISRAEMAAIIVRISGLESTVASAETKFDDVPASHWASGYVNIASTLGVINGDGNGKFRPDDKVKYNEAVKMLVCVLGYGMHAQEQGGWPAGYLIQATMLGVDDEVINQSGEASRETVAKLVYNTLDIEYLEKVGYGEEEQWVSYNNRTLLSEKLKIRKVEDIVSETYTTSLFGQGDLKENQVRIGLDRFLLTNADISRYIGYPVIAYAKYDPKVDKELSTIIHYEIDDEDLVVAEVSDKNFAGSTAVTVSLYNDVENSSKTTTYTTHNGTYYFVNGVGVSTYDFTNLFAGGSVTNQKVTIVDIDDDKSIDAVSIDESYTMVVRRAARNGDGFNVTGKYQREKLPTSKAAFDLSLGMDRVTITKDGEVIEYSDLEEFDVLNYTINASETICNITVTNKTVEGVVEAVTSDDEIVIDGVAYEKSSYYINKTAAEPTLACKLGDSVTMHLDMFGKVAYTEIDEVESNADSYGYVLGLESKQEFGEYAFELTLLTTDNEEVTFPVNSDVLFRKNVYYVENMVNAGEFNYTDGGATVTETLYKLPQKPGVEAGSVEKRFKSSLNKQSFEEFGLTQNYMPIRQIVKYAVSDDEIIEIEIPLTINGAFTSANLVADNATIGSYDLMYAFNPVDNSVVPAKVLTSATNAITSAANVASVVADNVRFKADVVATIDRQKVPNKFKVEQNVFNKTAYYGNIHVVDNKNVVHPVSGTLSETENSSGIYKYNNATLLFIPTTNGVVERSEIGFYPSSAFFGNYTGWSTALTPDMFEFYDVDRNGSAGLVVATVDKASGAFSDMRGTYMLIQKIGVGTNEDGEPVRKIVGLSNTYSSASTNEVEITIEDSEVVVTGELTRASDLKVGDIINYTKTPSGKVYNLDVIFALRANTALNIYDSDDNGGSISDVSNVTNPGTLFQGIIYAYLVSNSESDDSGEYIRLATATSGIDLEAETNVSGIFNPSGFTNYLVLKNNSLKQIDFFDVPYPQEVDANRKGEPNVVELTDENGDLRYFLCPKVIMQTHKSSDTQWRKITFIYVDEGLF